MMRRSLFAAARLASGALFALSAFTLLASLALIFLAGALLRGGGSDTLTQMINDALPGASVHSDAVAVEFSLSGIHLRAHAFTLASHGSHLAAEEADFWLQEDGMLKVALHGARLTLADITHNGSDGNAAALPPLAFEFSAPQAHLVLPAAGVTLSNADIVARGDAQGWRANLSQGQQLHLRASGDAQHALRLYAVIDNWTTPPPLAQQVTWSGMRATLAAHSGADGIRYRTHGTLRQLTDWRNTLTLHGVAWQVHGTCRSLRTCMHESGGQLSLRAALPQTTLSVHIANAGWRKLGTHWQVHAPALHLEQRTPQHAPSWQASVLLNADTQAQRFSLHSALPLPYLSPPRARTVSLSADGNWQRTATHLQVFAAAVHMADDTITLSAQAQLRAQEQHTTYQLRGTISTLPLTAVVHYLPHGEVQQWFAESVHGGTARQAAFALAVSDAPAQSMTLRLSTTFEDGNLFIAEGWAPATHLRGTLRLSETAMDIRGSGQFDGIRVSAVHAHLPLHATAPATLHLALHSAPTAVGILLNAARRSPATRDFMQQATQQLRLPPRGRGNLHLHLAVPLAQAQYTQAQATLAVRGAAVQVGDLPTYRDLLGTLHFSNTTYGGTLNGHLAGMQADAPRLIAAFNPHALTLHGVADISLLLAAAGMGDAPLSGSTPFTLSRTAAATLFAASLDGTVIDLPAPLGKGGFEVATLSARLGADESEMHYHTSQVTLHVRQRGGGSDIALNSRAGAPPLSGINLHGNAASVDLDLWLAQAGGSGTMHFATLQLTLRDAELTGISNARFIISGGSGGSGEPLSLHLDTTHSRGNVVFAARRLEGRFSHLSIPLGADTRSGSEGSHIASLTLNIFAETLVVGGLTLGALTLAGAPNDNAWQISTMRVDNAHLTMDVGGTYENTHTYLTMHLQVGNLPALMTILQIPQVFGGGRVSLFGSIGWPGAPTDFRPAKLVGNLRLLGEQVQYLDVDLSTDVVNFLSIFSPQSLFSLGFTELGRGGGIIFDSVQGDVELHSGEARFTPINLVSRDLRMDIQGSTDFVYHRYAIHGRVRPGEKLLAAGSVVGLGTGLTALNPATFVAGSLLGKIFEEPLSEIGAYDYTITGTWEDPVYEEIGLIRQVVPPQQPQKEGGGGAQPN